MPHILAYFHLMMNTNNIIWCLHTTRTFKFMKLLFLKWDGVAKNTSKTNDIYIIGYVSRQAIVIVVIYRNPS